MSEKKEEGRTRNDLIIGLRFGQLLCIAASIVGAVWGSSDYLLNTILVSLPIAPMSVLLMVYGTFGTLLCEVVIRVVRKKAPVVENGSH